MGRPKDEFEAFVVGEHTLPPNAPRGWEGEVLVHNITRGGWSVLSLAAFERQFEWI